MNKNILWIAIIFIVPLSVYWGLTRDDMTTLPVVAVQGDEVIKFYSPMCSECQELEKVFEDVYPKYSDKISIREINVSKQNKNCKSLIKEYKVTLVPTTVFKNHDGKITRRIEGTIQPKILENYLKELINE